ncbi:MAG: hypothetical protein CEN87_547 [Parcubacteria group bacterium Licking1014_1]|nr:MAG: hypothetical protein CEN87_547 [Parcubacteria group bacterium Licking1014_1]
MKKITFLNKWTEAIDEIKMQKIKEDYKFRFDKEYSIIFEHCIAYINRLINDLKYHAYLLKTNSINLVLLENDRFYIFLPKIDPLEFDEIYKDAISSGIKLSIRDISKEYLDVYNFYLSPKYNFNFFSRSSEEVILSTHKILLLMGKEYAKLRNTVNKIEKTGKAKYFSPSMADYDSLKNLSDNWFITQGTKYSSDRKKTDIGYLNFFLENVDDKRFISRAVYFNENLCGVALIEVVRPGFGIYIMNKCLNGFTIKAEVYGISGLSKYLYYKTSKELAEKGISFLNIGSLGTEEGARESKESLQPLKNRLESYQIDYGEESK